MSGTSASLSSRHGDFHVTTDNQTKPFDTDSDPACDPQIKNNGFCVVAGKKVQIDGSHTFAVTGSLPLVIVSQSTMQIDGTLDVASHRTAPSNKGPDASPVAPCAAVHARPAVMAVALAARSERRAAPAAARRSGRRRRRCLRRRRSMEVAGGSDGGSNGGQRGNGGGAVYLIALTNIIVTGTHQRVGCGW